jgi:hypothetical protein
MHALQIYASGTNITTGAASASVTIPNSSASGIKPKYVRLCASVACYAKVGPSGVTAAAGDILINPETPVILCVSGVTHVAAIQLAAAGVLNIVPIENQ